MKHNLLKSVIISVILLMGVSNAWAGDPYISGFGLQFRDDGGTWFKTGTKGGDGIMDLDLGSKTNLKIVYIYANGNKNGGNLCDNNYFKYGISGTTPTENWGGTRHSNVDWGTPTYKWGTENNQNAFIDLVQNRKPGNYSMEFIFSVEGNSNSNSCGKWYDCKYSNGNWKFTWSIPDPTITITGADALVVGTSTNIKATMSNYPIGSTISKIQVSGNTTSKSATGSTDNLTVSSVTPNASGKNGITVTVTVKFGTGGTKNYTYTYNVTPPAVNNFKVTASNVVSGTGTSGDPYIIACGKTTTLTVSGSKASTDANSSLYAKFGNNTYSSTLTKNLTPNSTKQSIQVKAKYYNSKDDLSGAETTTQTIYYRAQTFAVNITSSGNGTVNPSGTQQVGATPVSITATPNLGYAFKQWEVTGGAQVADATSASTKITATAAGTVTAVFEEKPATTIYLEPTNFWNSDNPTYVAHVWNASGNTDIPMTAIGEASHKYYTCKVPYGYTNVVFYRKSTNGSTIWNQTADLAIPADTKTLYEILSTGEGTSTKATGEWKEANLVYTITLGYCDFGTYGIKYNGQSYFSKKPYDNVTIDVPAGAQIEILEGQPHSNAYTGDIIKSKPTKEKLTTGQTLTINGDVTLDDNFITTTEHVVYLGIPDAINTKEIWAKADKANFIYTWDTYASYGLVASTGSFRIDALGITYYEFTIPEKRHSFRFQRKSSLNDNGSPYCESVSLEHEIPLTDVNCFTLKNEKDDNNRYKGTWGTLPAKQGDHRLLYIEQEVGLKNGHPETTVTKAHPSDIIRQGDNRTIYSLHIYNKVENGENGMNDPEILVQECTGYDGVDPIWTTRERHMVFGPLHADFGMAAMPGRRNADGDPDAVLRYDNGIEKIKNDINTTDPRFVDDQASGVWNFIVTRDDGSNNFAGLDLKQTARYTGDYYVRTDCADGGWDRYTLNGNHMTRSDISKRNSNYSHYYCKWIDQEGTNVTYIIANDYGMAISDTLIADETDIWGTPIADAQKIVTGETLPTNNEYGGANIRFSWNEKTDSLHRAYLAGSTDVSSRFLVLEGQSGQLYDAEGQALTQGANGSDRYGLKANEEIFTDISNWVYYADVQLVPNAGLKLTAKYMDKVQYFVGQADQYNNTVLAGTGSQKYLIRLLYDFKTNELISAYVPGGQAGKEIEAIETNLMLIRKENAAPTQLSFNTNNMRDVGKQAYGVLELTKATLIDNTQDKNIYERSLYWISFPFDVRITDIFGFGEYGKHWIIQSYNGAKRAANGLFLDSDTNWEYHFDPNTLNAGTPDQGIMKRGVGYVVALDLDQINADNPFVGRITTIALYFPSTNTITEHIVNKSEVIITVPEHVCTINRNTPNGDRRVKDSHWNVIGVPSYINAEGNFGSIEGKFDHIELENRPQELQFYYRWLGDHDKYEVTTPSATVNFNSLTAYMVQYAGDLTWTSVLNEGPASLAAKRNSDDMKQHHLRLELQQNGTEQDRTFIQLQEDEVTAGFDFNYDLCKINNSGANIYSLIATDRDPIEVAGNVMPVANTTIPLGVVIAAAGEYTFAMPEGTDGIMVELIDYEANTTTNLLFNDYTVNLPKGTFENRFALSVKPDKTATSLENIVNEATGDEVKKFIIDGVLYMQKDGVLYDAQGHIVR